MHAASRESQLAVSSKFDKLVGDLDSKGLAVFADELGSVAQLLTTEVLLRKHFAERTDDPAPKLALVDALLGKKLSAPALDLIRTAVAERWSVTRDLPEVLAKSAHLAVLIDAEREGQIENVEDELFRFGRSLDAYPKLATLLSDTETPVEGRLGLLDDVLAGKASDYTARLLRQALRLQRRENFDVVVPELAELAAARRGESVAHVTASTPLSDAQRDRLAGVLSQIYGRNMSIQLEIDPTVLGGLEITIGDEVVDGTIASRLASAASKLPR